MKRRASTTGKRHRMTDDAGRMLVGTKGRWMFQCPACEISISHHNLIMKHGSPALRNEWDSAWKAVTQRRTATKENPFEKPMAIKHRRRRKME